MSSTWQHMVRRLHASDLTELSPTCTINEDRARVLGDALVVSSTLTALHLRNCGMTAAGAARLAEGVGKSVSLITLYSFGNKIGDYGAQRIADSVAANSTLITLYLGTCGITAAGAAHIARGVRQKAKPSECA